MTSKNFIQTIHAGAGRGARLMLPAARDFNSQSERFAIRPLYVDPIPGRALELAADASRLGVTSKAYEGKVEDALSQRNPKECKALVLQIDRPAAVAKIISTAAKNKKPVLQYLILRVPDGNLFGIRLAIQSHEKTELQQAARFYECLSEVTARSSHSSILGEEGRSEHLVMEPKYRAWFANHMTQTLQKIVTDVEPNNHWFEITPDGRRTLRVAIKETGSTWADPLELVKEIAENPPLPILRGEEFIIAEINTKGLRFHRGGIRKLDGKLAMHGVSLVTEDAIRDAQVRERMRLEAESVWKRAERQTISRTQPAFATD